MYGSKSVVCPKDIGMQMHGEFTVSKSLCYENRVADEVANKTHRLIGNI